jgi:hypothetical protein
MTRTNWMKTRSRQLLKYVSAAAMTAVVALGMPATAVAQHVAEPQGLLGRLCPQSPQGPEGSWLYTVTIPGFTTFQGVETYSAGGGYSEADQLSFTPGSVATAGHGAWKSTGEKTFLLTYVGLTFESFNSGVATGSIKVRQNTKIDKTGNSYTGFGDYAYYGTDGKALEGDGLSGSFTITATRIVVQAPR